jgi:hypothetical protein
MRKRSAPAAFMPGCMHVDGIRASHICLQQSAFIVNLPELDLRTQNPIPFQHQSGGSSHNFAYILRIDNLVRCGQEQTR